MTDSRFAYNRSEARLASPRYFQTVHFLLLGVPRRAERDQFPLWSFRIPPCPHRRSRASISCYSSLPSEPRGVPGNHPHREDTGIPFRFARYVAQHETNPDDARISSRTRCLPLLSIRLRHPTESSNPCLVLDRSAGEWLAPGALHTDPGPAPRRMPRRRAARPRRVRRESQTDAFDPADYVLL